jgi:hypothetical protein
MRRVIIPAEDLPVTTDGVYTIRFRIVSEDRNRFSEWSPFYSYDSNELPPTT